jgi:PhnB protein
LNRETVNTEYKLNPYLTIKDSAADAIELYGKAFGAVEVHRMPAEDGKRLIHAEITVNGAVLMLADNFPEYCGHGGETQFPSAEKPGAVSIALHFKSPEEVDSGFKRATDAGCKPIMPPDDTFWNARFGIVVDPYGHQWLFNAPLPPKS